jgi:phenylacetic acid degradation operon negative regulatory protein
MTELTDKRLQRFCRQDRMQAGSLIISMFGDAIYPRGGVIWLGCLIRLLAPLQVNERLIRTAIYRLVKEDWLVTHTQGRRTDYALSASGIKRIEEASKAIYASQSPPWDERWRLLLAANTMAKKDRERLRKALVWQGFGMWQNQVFVHPGADLQVALSLLQGEGLGHLQKHIWPLAGDSLLTGAGFSDQQVATLSWDLAQLAHSYRQFVKTYQALVDEWPVKKTCKDHVQNEKAFLLRLLLIHDYRRLLLRDPSLPQKLLPGDWPGQSARAVCARLYAGLSVPSETYLQEHMQLADGRLTGSLSLFQHRFRIC